MPLSFDIDMPEMTDLEFDVVERRLEIVIRNEEPVAMAVPPDQLVVGPHFGNHNDSLRLQLRNVNSAGNESEPRILETVLKDPFHPPTPGEMAVRITGKTFAQDRNFHVQITDTKKSLDVDKEEGVLKDVVIRKAEPSAG